jgi:hypothetical protein
VDGQDHVKKTKKQTMLFNMIDELIFETKERTDRIEKDIKSKVQEAEK